MSENIQLLRSINTDQLADDGLVTVIVEFGGDWQADITFYDTEGKMAISRLVVEQIGESTRSSGITADLLRELKLGPVRPELKKHLVKHASQTLDKSQEAIDRIAELTARVEENPDGPDTNLARFERILLQKEVEQLHVETKQAVLAASSRAPSPASRVKRKSDGFYVLVALVYLALADNGISRGINAELVRVLTPLNNGVSPSEVQVKNWLQAATKRNLLGPGQRGRAGRAEGTRLRSEFNRLWPEGIEIEETP
ncbi:hypothetical protein OAG98_02705 [Acidimicrobiales bacterium]|nr:hypothetical protein [Acidimicrobiales bacterium]